MNTQSEAFSDTSTSVEVRKVKAGPPLSWIVDSTRLIRAHWKTVIPAYLIVTIGTILIQFGIVSMETTRPGIGLVILLLVGVFLALLLQSGMTALFHGVAERQPRIADVFRGLQGHSVLGLFLLIVAMVLVTVVFGLVVFLFIKLFGAGNSMMGLLDPHGSYDQMMGAMVGGTGLFMGLVLLGMALVTALFCYAIPLIVISKVGVLEAMGNSFQAGFKNLFVLCIFGMNIGAVYFLTMIIPMIGGAISTSVIIFLGVMGLVIWLFGLVVNGAYYLSFRDVLLVRSSSSNASAE